MDSLTVRDLVTMLIPVIAVVAALSTMRVSLRKMNGMPETMARVDTRLVAVERDVAYIKTSGENARDKLVKLETQMVALHERIDK